MAISGYWYTLALAGQFGSSPVNWTADTIKVSLHTSSYTPNRDTHQFFTSVSGSETTGTGYTAGGVTLTGKSVGAVVTPNTVPLLASASSWTGASFTTRYAVIYKSTGTSSTSPLLGYVDFGGDETVSSGNFSITWDTTYGVLKIAGN